MKGVKIQFLALGGAPSVTHEDTTKNKNTITKIKYKTKIKSKNKNENKNKAWEKENKMIPGRPEDQMQGDRGLDFLLTETYAYRNLSGFPRFCKHAGRFWRGIGKIASAEKWKEKK